MYCMTIFLVRGELQFKEKMTAEVHDLRVQIQEHQAQQVEMRKHMREDMNRQMQEIRNTIMLTSK